MFLDIIALFVSFLCLIIIVMTIGSYRFQKEINIPFVVIILFVGIQRFQSSLTNLNLVELKSPFEEFPLFALIFIPLFLYFFKTSTEEKNISRKDLAHFILPIILISFKKL